ncbi:AAA-12 domain-containing protein [Fusarium keratoplasticum]|uniref:AAA-12 domain-containing protein n=1 Tax=Fusarium keratoplasticum TaxID=1328300 RepID=A0ACC0QGA0_9HYPO|nr:AAA-12 domain-containing protein [Fusarium keratoplasticum]KAI8654529.1 AAA-12 domain-containing protein [Fusarium keratoplasticum]
MATTKQAGPGMMTDEHHLNVMLSRHRSGLIIVGDIHVTGMLDGANGEVSWVNATVLRSAQQALWESNRVITV